MKKSILAVAVLLGAGSVFAQDLTSKKGEAFLPEAGDWAVSIDANPFLNYFGNFIGGNGLNTAPSWNYLTNNQTITGKYFVEDDMAYRASLRLGFGSDKEKMMVDNRTDDFNATATPSPWPGAADEVENTMKTGNMNIGLAVGLEKRRGFGRLQGFYGAELGINLSSSSEKYTYGNALVGSVLANDAGNVDVTGADDFGGNVITDTDGLGNVNNARILTQKNGLGFDIGVRAFIGAEYFVLPRLAVGGEFGWGLMFGLDGKSKTTYETEGHTSTQTLGTDAYAVQEITDEGTSSSEFGVDTESLSTVFGNAGRLKITFHF